MRADDPSGALGQRKHCVLVRTHSLAKLVLHAELRIGHLYEEEFVCTAVVAVPDIVGKCMMPAALRMRPARVRPKLSRHKRPWMALITTSFTRQPSSRWCQEQTVISMNLKLSGQKQPDWGTLGTQCEPCKGM